MSVDSADAPPPPPPPPPPPDYSAADEPVVDHDEAAAPTVPPDSAEATAGEGLKTFAGVDDVSPADVPVVDEGQATPDLPGAGDTQPEFGGRPDMAAQHPDLYSYPDSPPPQVDGPHEPPENWAGDINPGNGEENCGDCARAVQDTWEGNPRVAAVGGPEDDSLIADWAGAEPEPVSTGEINDKLAELGPGSSAVVRCDWEDGGGHYFNAVNDEGTVKAVDGQSGQVESWPPSDAGLRFSPEDMKNVEAIFFDSNGKVVK